MAESFSRQKSRHAPQKEGGLKILCDPGWYVHILMSRMDGKKTHTHTHTHKYQKELDEGVSQDVIQREPGTPS